MNKYAIIFSLFFVSSFSYAQEKGEGPCAKDRETLCSGIEPGDGRVAKCMKENKEKLSTECKAHREKMKEVMKGVKEACQDDVEKFCGDVKKGGGLIMRCMKKHKAELSEGCKSEMAEAKGMRKQK